jgi:hypothetical protein
VMDLIGVGEVTDKLDALMADRVIG